MRLDLYLVEKGFFESRNKAKNEIEASNILVNDNVVIKPSYDVLNSDIIKIKPNILKYVSRGGLKLEGAINDFKLDFNNKVILDLGASTGGFTDCSLQYGAKLVYAVDVGNNQLHQKLKGNNKVISYENTNILDINIDMFNIPYDYIVMDVSFVSIIYLLDKLNELILDNVDLVYLIKPQFEVGKIKFKNGIVKDKKLHINVINNIIEALSKYNLGIKYISKSKIEGGDGNIEYVCLIRRGIKTNIDVRRFVLNC